MLCKRRCSFVKTFQSSSLKLWTFYATFKFSAPLHTSCYSLERNVKRNPLKTLWDFWGIFIIFMKDRTEIMVFQKSPRSPTIFGEFDKVRGEFWKFQKRKNYFCAEEEVVSISISPSPLLGPTTAPHGTFFLFAIGTRFFEQIGCTESCRLAPLWSRSRNF